MPIDRWLTAIRYTATGRGHYESFYLKANHPSRRLGVWLKFNLLEPRGPPDRLEGELWGMARPTPSRPASSGEPPGAIGKAPDAGGNTRGADCLQVPAG